MKTLVKMMVLVTMMIVFTAAGTREARAQHFHAQVSFQLFYDQLSPYGFWVNDPYYGYIWVPEVGPGFYPYSTNGYWTYTHFGWTWVSDYPWGWAPFHYGRWYYDPFYGHVWIPGTEWGPAWVVWRHGHGYYGWAPLGPDISIQVAFRPTYVIPHEHWIFVRERDFGRRDLNRYYVDRSSNVNIYNNTTVIQNTYVDASRNSTYISGPDRVQVEKVTGRTIKPVAVRDADQPRQQMANNELQIYRPKVEKSDARNPRPAPSKVVKSGEKKGEVEKGAPAKEVRPGGSTRQAQPAERMTKPEQDKPAAPTKKLESPAEKKSTPPARQMKQPEKKEQAVPAKRESPQQQKKTVAPAKQVDRPAQQKEVRQAPSRQTEMKKAPAQQKQANPSGKQTQQKKSKASPDRKSSSQQGKGRGK